jgi:hypothetical protein
LLLVAGAIARLVNLKRLSGFKRRTAVIIDYRVYLTIYAVLMVAHFASLFFIDSNKAFYRYVTVVCSLALLTALINYIDWLWS